MIVVSYTFTLPKPVTREEARSIFLSSAPKYRGVKGLVRKHYVVSEDGTTAGGVYIWNSRAEAEALYTEIVARIRSRQVRRRPDRCLLRKSRGGRQCSSGYPCRRADSIQRVGAVPVIDHVLPAETMRRGAPLQQGRSDFDR